MMCECDCVLVLDGGYGEVVANAWEMCFSICVFIPQELYFVRRCAHGFDGELFLRPS